MTALTSRSVTGQASIPWSASRHVSKHLQCRDFKQEEGRKEMFYSTTYSTHLNYGYMASEIRREQAVVVHAFRLAGRVLLYAPSHYTNRGGLDGTRNSSLGST